MEYRSNLIHIKHNNSHYIAVKAQTILEQFLFFSKLVCSFQKMIVSNLKVPELFSNIFTLQYCYKINQAGTDCCLLKTKKCIIKKHFLKILRFFRLLY